ncbi:hypothetical protein N5T90_06570 [Aliarcobacter cryaerophilus]|uniref:hypothetical protein n=1 Tax=Aliarcobacter cryaerophilus TaxID=28198 RepID=UPI0021B5EEE3|nr:hypothetical protein [Aliarcobacter cryaerophilus]MCT7470532.1 hypothetical protein [Aliarcobacter cryaerophilus]
MNLFKRRPNFNQNLEQKIEGIKLKIEKQNSKIFSNSTDDFKISAGKNGVKVNNQTVIFKTNFTQTGYNKSSRTVLNSSQVGSKAAANIDYIDRDKANEKEENEALSNSYSMTEKLTKEDLESLKNDIKEGTESFRRDVVSLGFDDKLTTKEQLEIIRESYNSFNDDFKKNPQNIIISIHNNTDHKHAHVLVTGKKEDTQLNKQQLQHIKLTIASKTAAKLNEKGQVHSLENLIKKEERKLQVMEKYTDLREKINSKEKDFELKVEQEFNKFSKVSLSNEEKTLINDLQKARGYKQFLEKDKENNQEKIAKAEKWEKKAEAKIKLETLGKFEYLKQEIEEFKKSDNFKNLNKEFKDEQRKLNKENLKIEEKELKPLSLDKALKTDDEQKIDKNLTYEQQIDKAIDGKLDNKMRSFQY